VLAPLHDPIRLAEDAATVQLLSHGRLLLGLGLGWSTVEYHALGADMHRRGAAMEEMLRLLPQAWTGQPFRHSGEVYDIPEIAVRPAPSQRIPIVVGGSAEAAIRRAARLADGIFANAPVERFLQIVEWVRDELERVGRDPATFRVIHYSVLLPASSEAESLALYGDHLWAMTWKYTDMEASASRPGPPPSPPAPPADRRDLLKGRAVFAGPPERVVEGLLDVRERAGVAVEFVARSYFSTLPYEQQVELMQVLAEGVAPHL
jgi:alkanesulfonate monooxygenase SsuD/methylene tetrahydromethanopterin reductase-like flavin-dependent oxidoreductase (luciferase family)